MSQTILLQIDPETQNIGNKSSSNSPDIGDDVLAPKTAFQLERSESVVRKGHFKTEKDSGYTFNEFQYKGSVIPSILAPTAVITAWAILFTLLFKLMGNAFKDIAVAPTLITILSIVVGLLLVFRTNTAYDRF